jgi:hypothetical protein
MQPSPLHEMERMDEMDEMERTLRGLDQSEDGSGNCAFGSWREEARFFIPPRWCRTLENFSYIQVDRSANGYRHSSLGKASKQERTSASPLHNKKKKSAEDTLVVVVVVVVVVCR